MFEDESRIELGTPWSKLESPVIWDMTQPSLALNSLSTRAPQQPQQLMEGVGGGSEVINQRFGSIGIGDQRPRNYAIDWFTPKMGICQIAQHVFCFQMSSEYGNLFYHLLWNIKISGNI